MGINEEKDQTPHKEVLFKNLNLAPSFPLTKKAKRVFHQTLPPKKKGFKKESLKKDFKKKEGLKETP